MVADTEALPVPSTRIVILADDLIWSTRLVGHVRTAGLEAVPVRVAEAYAVGAGRSPSARSST